MTQQIEVLDALPGSGKTYAILKYISEHKEIPWLYITPMLSELEVRIPKPCRKSLTLEFMIPEGKGNTKASEVLDFLKEGKHIACTHELTEVYTRAHKRNHKTGLHCSS